MTDQLITPAEFHRIVDSEAAWFHSYMTALAERTDPRLGARVVPIHDAGCFATRLDCAPQDFFRNRVLGGHRVPTADLPDVMARAREVYAVSANRAALDVVPGAWPRESLTWLRQNGYDRTFFAFQAQFRGRARDATAELAALAETGVVRRSTADDALTTSTTAPMAKAVTARSASNVSGVRQW